eukprot:TRINITY_DN4016_c0_g1_i2.p2 TRINITY_DN4016_c0_g1~~TRINITY_DN4016_c0_g1_i2.p2  ORF type:complete len:158 (+),score=56.11 TRINITY_DN4016_c0_g1_i2:120-593(+)
MMFPLPEPHGYQYSYAQLSPVILANAAVLYVAVTPAMSREKNTARGKEGVGTPAPSIGAQIMHSLNHCVPDHVMWNDYGTDDVAHLVATSDKPSTIKIVTGGKTFYLPIAFLDNTKDLTTFCRKDVKDWTPAEKEALHSALVSSFAGLVQQYQLLHS